MSEYSTEQLVGLLENHKVVIEAIAVPNMADKPFKPVIIDFGGEIRDAIIARLRAADALVAFDKKMMVKVAEGTGVTLVEMATWVKAIADYEGKK